MFQTNCAYVESTTVTNVNQAIFNIQQIVSSINTGLASSTIALNTAHPGTITTTPQIFWSVEDQMYKFLLGTEFDTSSTLKLCLGRTLWLMVGKSFNTIVDFSQTFTNPAFNDYLNVIVCGVQYQNRVSGVSLSALTIPDAAGTKRIIYPEYSYLEGTYKIDKLRVVLTECPLNSEIIVPSSVTSQSSAALNIATENILLDMDISINNLGDHNKLVYSPQFITYHNLNGRSPFSRMKISIYTIDTANTPRLLSLPPDYSCTIKFCFRRRGHID
jgi:hypothetical protein